MAPFLKSLLFSLTDRKLNFIDYKNGKKYKTFDLEDFSTDFLDGLPKKTEGFGNTAPLTDILDNIGEACGDLVLFEVGGFINVGNSLLDKVIKMGCRVSWISVPQKEQLNVYGGELKQKSLKTIVEATGGISLQFGVHGKQTGDDLPKLIPKFPYITTLLRNVIKGEDSIQLMDFIAGS